MPNDLFHRADDPTPFESPLRDTESPEMSEAIQARLVRPNEARARRVADIATPRRMDRRNVSRR